MIKYKTDLPLEELTYNVNEKIESARKQSSHPGFLMVSNVDGEDVEQFRADFAKRGYKVSNLTTTGKIAILWDENQLKGFAMSGYSFE